MGREERRPVVSEEGGLEEHNLIAEPMSSRTSDETSNFHLRHPAHDVVHANLVANLKWAKEEQNDAGREILEQQVRGSECWEGRRAEPGVSSGKQNPPGRGAFIKSLPSPPSSLLVLSHRYASTCKKRIQPDGLNL